MYLDREVNSLKIIQDLQDNSATTWNVWLELVESGVSSLLPFDKNNQSLIFFKLFIPEERLLVYCGYYFVTYDTTIGMHSLIIINYIYVLFIIKIIFYLF